MLELSIKKKTTTGPDRWHLFSPRKSWRIHQKVFWRYLTYFCVGCSLLNKMHTSVSTFGSLCKLLFSLSTSHCYDVRQLKIIFAKRVQLNRK